MDWKAAPSLSALRGFEAAARLGSLSRAADELNVTHAAIAQHVRTVEAFVGVSLLERAGRGMEPTEAGARLQPALTDGFSRILDAVADLTEQRSNGPLRVTTTPSFAEHWLMPRLVSFWAEHPDIAVSVASSFDVVDMRRDGFDLALRYGRGDWSGVDAQFLVAADYIVAAAPQVVAGRKIARLSDLYDDIWLQETRFGEARKWAEAQNVPLDQLQTRDVGEGHLVLAATRAGAGVSVQSRTLIAADLAAGTLVDVWRGTTEKGVGYYMVSQAGRSDPRLQTFQRWLRRNV